MTKQERVERLNFLVYDSMLINAEPKDQPNHPPLWETRKTWRTAERY